MTRIIVCGASGRMGTSITEVIQTTPGIQLGGLVERPGSTATQDKASKVTDDLESVISHGDVLISFASPDGSMDHLRTAVKHHKGIVIGTTGFSEEQKKEIAKLAKKTPVVLAPNMSIGVNVMWKLVQEAARVLKNYNISISETHHVHKKDAPSGTALKIAEMIEKAAGRPSGTVPIESKREGEVVGDHTALFESLEETLEITHRAFNRNVFAQGAVRAAQWLTTQPAGLYSMFDVLGL